MKNLFYLLLIYTIVMMTVTLVTDHNSNNRDIKRCEPLNTGFTTFEGTTSQPLDSGSGMG